MTRSRLVSVDGYGHGVYILDDNPCALNVGTAYLVDGEFPRRDVNCRAERGSGLALNADRLRLRERTLEQLGLAAPTLISIPAPTRPLHHVARCGAGGGRRLG